MLNVVWIGMLFAAIAFGALSGRLDDVAKASTTSAAGAVDLAIGLVGMMALWLGFMRVLHEAGLLRTIAHVLRKPMRWLFPDVPEDHPAISMMILNMASNMLGLVNAATPFGIKAMIELNKLNKRKGVATDAMAMLLAINTSNVALLPSGMIALRASLGSESPGAIFATTLLATSCSTMVAIITAKFLCRLPVFSAKRYPESPVEEDDSEASDDPVADEETQSMLEREGGKFQSFWGFVGFIVVVEILVLALGTALYGKMWELGATEGLKYATQQWPLVLLMGLIVGFGVLKRVNVYDAIVVGGKEGFTVALRIIPFLVAILVAVGMLRASGAIDLMVQVLEPFTSRIGMPAEVTPLALLRSLSGSGGFALSAEIMKEYGPDSFIGLLASTMQGSSDTTFYILAVYFGAISVKHGRHTLLACLTADAAGILASVAACHLLL